MSVLRHAVTVAAALFVTLGLPFVTSDKFHSLISGSEDAVSSASVTVDKPSGKYTVLINNTKHPDKENLEVWQEFFSGNEIDFLFEDIVCTCASGDSGGITMAQSFQSRLPENQMKIKTEDPVLMLSKAEYGRFDVMIMSSELADSFGAQTLYENKDYTVIFTDSGEADDEKI